MTLYIIQSASGNFLDKHLVWLEAPQVSQLFRTSHRDVALNQLIELNTKDVHLRAWVIACESNEHGDPVIDQQPLQAVSQACR
jgi:hypothetical protein